jgi:hypothetical protein
MKKALIGLLVLLSFATFASSEKKIDACIGLVMEEIFSSPTLNETLIAYIDSGDEKALIKICDSAYVIAKLSCTKL